MTDTYFKCIIFSHKYCNLFGILFISVNSKLKLCFPNHIIHQYEHFLNIFSFFSFGIKIKKKTSKYFFC